MTVRTTYASVGAIGDRIYPVIAGHIDLAFRRLALGPGVCAESRFVRVVTGEPHPFGNFACMVDPAGEEATRAAVEPLRRVAAPAAVLFTGVVTRGVAALMEDAGFEAHGEMPAMAVDIDKLAATTLPAGYTIERVSDVARRSAWAEVFARGYELPRGVGEAFAGGVNGDARADVPMQCFWIRKRGEPVATSAMLLDRGVAGIYSVATVKEERGKGLAAHATAWPLRAARELGYRVGVLQSSEQGHSVYRRLGFGEFGGLPLWVRAPG